MNLPDDSSRVARWSAAMPRRRALSVCPGVVAVRPALLLLMVRRREQAGAGDYRWRVRHGGGFAICKRRLRFV